MKVIETTSKKPSVAGTHQNAKAAYDIWHADKGVDDLIDSPWHQMIKSHLSMADIAGKRVLEIGCGRGGFACWLASQKPRPERVIGSDFSASAVGKGQQFARTQGISTIDWQISDIQAIAHLDESFDTVFSCETIEHVPDPWIAVKELSRVLKPGGTLFLSTPNYFGDMGLYRVYVRLMGRRYTEVGQPINNVMLLPVTRRMVTKAGLTIKTIDGVGHRLPVWMRNRPANARSGWLLKEVRTLDNPHVLMRWFGRHCLVLAAKPLGPR